MKRLLQKIPDSLLRVGTVFIVFIAAVILVRSLIPASLKNTEEHRKATIEREVAHPVRYAGSEVCADCHEQFDLKKKGYHKNLACETCHGVAKEHTENPGDVKPVKNTKREACVLCHIYNPSRPTGFPQINPSIHNPMRLCIECHNPHDPKPQHTPQDCQACHAQIARTKAVSSHARLECTTCHTVPEQHKITPRQVRPTIPSDRSFCGKCHAKESKFVGTTKIDLVMHGEKYLCWQCHYPHMPEVE